MDEVCRLCLADTTSCDEYNSYDGRIQLLIPEIDLNVTPTFTLCENCSGTLDSAYIFKQKCLQIEERINNYISKIQTPLTDLRWVRDQNYDCNDNVTLKEVYEISDSNSDTDSANLDDRKDIDSISVEYNLIFPTYVGKECKEGIEDKEIRKESFKSVTELDQHHRIVHSEPNISPNDSGNKKFVKESHRHHMRDCHMKKHICKFCNKKFRANSVLLQHMRMHTGDRPYQCEVCQKGFTRKSILRAHVPIHKNVKPYMCNICHKAYKVKDSLDEHMATHIPNSGKRLICDIATCNRIFKTTKGLNLHKLRHQLGKTIQCSLCDKQFYNTTPLTIHMRSHTGEKPYQCDICHKLFKHKHSMKKHFQAHSVKKV